MYARSQAVCDFAASVTMPEESEAPGLRNAQVEPVVGALLNDAVYGVGAMPALMVNELGRPQSEADAMQAAIDSLRAAHAAWKVQIDALNAILDG